MTKRFAMYFCLAFLLSACGQSGKDKANEPMTVKVSKAELMTDNAGREFTFISKPFRTTDLSFRVGGPIERFEVYVGNSYKRGETIAEIDPRDFRIRKERAEAVYTQAKAEYERIKVLYEKNNISASAYEKARAECTSAKTAFETATNELNDTRLIAPFNGYIGEVYIEKYQDVKATQPVVSFIDIDRLKIETYVTQDIAFVSQNADEVSLRFDAKPDSVYRAKVEEVSKGTTRNNISYLLTALLPNNDGKLLAGMSGKVLFDASSVSSGSKIAITQTALCNRPSDGDYVWVVESQTRKVTKRKVTVGGLLPGGKVAVTSGLQAGEVIAASGLRFLSDGMTVIISQ